MTHLTGRRRLSRFLATGCSAVFLAGCNPNAIDLDLRGLSGGFSTADAARGSVAARPKPDARGVISYPNYQVAVARRGDTLTDVAQRVGLDAVELARFNGLRPDTALRRDEIIALPTRVAEASTGRAANEAVDIQTLAGNAIDRSAPTSTVQTDTLPPATQAPAPRQAAAQEPVRHKVERGETAYTISRLYNVPVKALAEWNGLNSDFAIRAGQYLLIPVAKQAPPPLPTAQAATPLPGAGSPTPTPPSAARALPDDDTARPLPPEPEDAPPVADLGEVTQPPEPARLVKPVDGSIIRDYAKGRNEGISIKAAPGTPVKSADVGTVAAITESADGIPIVVVRHADNLLTVYANVAEVTVTKGDRVARGQSIAKLRDGRNSYVHFEVRQGFDSVDPTDFIN
ncbi:MAG: LysM peptidoglycan-binding domain-containing protein [Pseudomonadota bacterium]